MDLSVVVMAFNEESSLEYVVQDINNILDEIACRSELIIIDDGSSDDTGQISDNLAQKNNRISVIHHGENKGLGEVYRTGFNIAQGELITFFPADGQFSGSIIKSFLQYLIEADMVLGYLVNQNRSLLSVALSKAERLLYYLLFGPIPKFQGILMFRRKLLEEFKLKSTGRGWAILLELIIRTQRSGHRIMSLPIEVRPRMSGRSKVNNLKTVYANIRQALILSKLLG